MGWLQSFHSRDKNARTAWGYTFQLTSDHPTKSQLEPLKYSYDTVGESASTALDEIASTYDCDRGVTSGTARKKYQRKDLFVVLKDNHDKHKALERLWLEVHAVPDWICWVGQW